MSDSARPTHAADRLIAAIEAKKSPVCVGLDPVLEKMPWAGRCGGGGDPKTNAAVLFEFCQLLLAGLARVVPCIKIQSACFERYGALDSALELAALASLRGVEVILDAKRGDIGVSAEHYAAGTVGRSRRMHETSVPGPDWITINSYLGEDGITPFLQEGHGAFALVRTSNPGGDEVQNMPLQDGRTVAHAVAEMVARVGADRVGGRGYSSLGAVVGATKPHDAKRLRDLMPQQMFLVPGYGAQGGGIDDVLPCFKSDGGGAIVTASRSVIYAFKPDDPKWMDSVADAAAKFAEEVGRAVGMR